MNLQKIPLKTVRQFFIQDVVLGDYPDLFTPDTPQVTKKVENLCYAKVTPIKHPLVILSSMSSSAPSHPRSVCHSAGHRDAGGSGERKTWMSAHPRETSYSPEGEVVTCRHLLSALQSNLTMSSPPQVDYSGGFDTFHTSRFSQKFVEHVANPKDIIHFLRRREQKEDNKGLTLANCTAMDLQVTAVTDPQHSPFHAFQSLCFLDEVNVDYGSLLKTTAAEGLRVEDLVKQYFAATEQVPRTHTHTGLYAHTYGVS